LWDKHILCIHGLDITLSLKLTVYMCVPCILGCYFSLLSILKRFTYLISGGVTCY